MTTAATSTRIPQKAFGGCDTGGGGIKSCTATAVASAPNHILDTADVTHTCEKLPSDDDNPCAFVTAGPVLSISDREIRRAFTTNSGRVGMTLLVGQMARRFEETLVPPDLTLFSGRQFTVKRLKTAESVRLECRTENGEQIIAPIGPANINDQLKFVRVLPSEPYDLYTYEVIRP